MKTQSRAKVFCIGASLLTLYRARAGVNGEAVADLSPQILLLLAPTSCLDVVDTIKMY